MPAGIELAIAGDANFLGTSFEVVDFLERLPHFTFGPHDPDIILHHIL